MKFEELSGQIELTGLKEEYSQIEKKLDKLRKPTMRGRSVVKTLKRVNLGANKIGIRSYVTPQSSLFGHATISRKENLSFSRTRQLDRKKSDQCF
jgi:hypothetical protein